MNEETLDTDLPISDQRPTGRRRTRWRYAATSSSPPRSAPSPPSSPRRSRCARSVTAAALDWALFAVLGVITVLHLAALADGRAPLLVADRLGVRLRQGAEWQGIAWDDIECMEHLPRRLPLHDGHLLVVGESGQQLIVPLTLATRVVGADRGAPSVTSSPASPPAAPTWSRWSTVSTTTPTAIPTTSTTRSSSTTPWSVLPTRPAEASSSEIGPLWRRTRSSSSGAGSRPRWRSGSGSRSPQPADVDGRRHRRLASTRSSPRRRPTRLAADETEADRRRSPTRTPTRTPTPPAPGRPVVGAARVEVQHAGRGSFARGRDDDGSTGSHPTIGANALVADPIGRARRRSSTPSPS